MTAAATVSMPKTKRRFRTGTIVLAVAGIIFVVMAILVNTQDAFKQYTWLRVFFGVSALNFTLRASVPLILGALCGILCERTGIVNIGIEGMMLAGAYAAFVAKVATSRRPPSMTGARWNAMPACRWR